MCAQGSWREGEGTAVCVGFVEGGGGYSCVRRVRGGRGRVQQCA